MSRVRRRAYPSESDRRDLEVIAALVAELISSRRFYGDAVEHTRRRLPMQVAAEIIWNQLPPLTLAVDGTVLTAVLEPCYDVGGDAFDYAANGNRLHVGLFDKRLRAHVGPPDLDGSQSLCAKSFTVGPHPYR